MHARALLCTTACALLLAGGCRDGGVGPGDPSWFRASLEGAVSGEFEGAGDYSFERDDGGTPPYFRIFAQGGGSARVERFYLRWPSTSLPAVGAHPLVPHTDEHGSTAGATAVYRWSRGDNVSAPLVSELYVADSGVVEITRSAADGVEGTLRFTGVQSARTGENGPERGDPRHQPDPAAPRVEVRGSFRVVPTGPISIRP